MRVRIETLLCLGERVLTIEERPDGNENRLVVPTIGLIGRRKFAAGFCVTSAGEIGWYGSPEPVSLTTAWWLLQLLDKLDRLSVQPDLVGLLADALDGSITEEGREFAAQYFGLAPEAFMSLVSEVFLTRVPANDAVHMLRQLPEAAIDFHRADLESAMEAHQLQATPQLLALLGPAQHRFAEAEVAFAAADTDIDADLAPEHSLGQLLTDLGISEVYTPFGPEFFWPESTITSDRVDWLIKSAGIGRHAMDGPLPLLSSVDASDASQLLLEIVGQTGPFHLNQSLELASPIIIEITGCRTILHAARYDGEQIWVKASMKREPDSDLLPWENDDAVFITVFDLRSFLSRALGHADADPGTPLRPAPAALQLPRRLRDLRLRDLRNLRFRLITR